MMWPGRTIAALGGIALALSAPAAAQTRPAAEASGDAVEGPDRDDAAAAAVPLPLGLRAGELAAPLPADTATDRAWVALGARLFADPILSLDRSVSCASCHPAATGFASAARQPAGVGGRRAARHAPTLFNRAFGTLQGWDGKSPDLEHQVLAPIEHPDEMSLSIDDPKDGALARLRSTPEYAAAFAAVDAAAITRPDLARALATYLRTLLLGDSVVDRFQAATSHRISPEVKLGLWVYESKGRCWRCHSGGNFSDEAFHNTGVGVRDGRPEPGRFAVTGDPADRGAFKTPTLRGLAQTAPYMHDGSLETLEEVVEFYRRGGNANADLDRKIAPLDLSDREARGLVAFLRALSEPAR